MTFAGFPKEREEYLERTTKTFLNRNYGGSFAKMLTMLNGGVRLDESEMKALRKVLEEWENE